MNSPRPGRCRVIAVEQYPMDMNGDGHADPQPAELGISLTDHRLATRANMAEMAAGLVPNGEPWSLRYLHFGNEFCDRLLPSPRRVDEVLAAAQDSGLRMSLATPMVTEDGMARIRALLRHLPGNSEVIVNDWGVVRLLRDEFADLRPVAGRQLCKMIKDPRLPSPDWKALAPPGLRSPLFRDLLAGLGIGRVEIDVPPFAGTDDFAPLGLALSVHMPFGFAAKGRVCKIGSLHQRSMDKFRPDRQCAKECLRFFAKLGRKAPAGLGEPQTFQRGNTLFYRHTSAMTEALVGAARRGWIDRIIVAGDWHENNRADQHS